MKLILKEKFVKNVWRVIILEKMVFVSMLIFAKKPLKENVLNSKIINKGDKLKNILIYCLIKDNSCLLTEINNCLKCENVDL